MDKIIMDKELARDLLKILNLFTYEEDEDSCVGMSFFKARLNEDSFFLIKDKLERELEKEENK